MRPSASAAILILLALSVTCTAYATFDKTLFLDLQFNESGLTLTNYLVAYSTPPEQIVQPDHGMTFEIYADNGSVLYSFKEQDPRIVFTDTYDNGSINGTVSFDENASFSLALPFYKNASKLVVSNEATKIGNIDLAALASEFCVLTSYYPDYMCDSDCSEDADCMSAAGEALNVSNATVTVAVPTASFNPVTPAAGTPKEKSDLYGILAAGLILILIVLILLRGKREPNLEA